MDRFRGKPTLFIIFSLIILFPQIVSTVAFEQHKQYISDRVREMYSLVTTSSMSSWDKVRSLVNQVQKQYFPPNLEPRDEGGHSSSSGSNDDGAKERMQDAAGKSFGASKAAVEESAKSAAKVVGEAVHKTTEKVKDCIGDACHSEL